MGSALSLGNRPDLEKIRQSNSIRGRAWRVILTGLLPGYGSEQDRRESVCGILVRRLVQWTSSGNSVFSEISISKRQS